jgi:integrase
VRGLYLEPRERPAAAVGRGRTLRDQEVRSQRSPLLLVPLRGGRLAEDHQGQREGQPGPGRRIEPRHPVRCPERPHDREVVIGEEAVEVQTAANRRPGTDGRKELVLRGAVERVDLERVGFAGPRRSTRFAFFPEDETRVRWLRPEEEILVLDTMASPFREMAKLAALTLMRLSEIRLLRREYVHLEQGVVLLPQAKARPVILSEDARKIMQRQLEAHDREWVFPNADGGPWSRQYLSHVFRKAARRAGLKDSHFHDLRHHGATMALNANFSAPIVQQLGGWKTEAHDAPVCRCHR